MFEDSESIPGYPLKTRNIKLP